MSDIKNCKLRMPWKSIAKDALTSFSWIWHLHIYGIHVFDNIFMIVLENPPKSATGDNTVFVIPLLSTQSIALSLLLSAMPSWHFLL